MSGFFVAIWLLLWTIQLSLIVLFSNHQYIGRIAYYTLLTHCVSRSTFFLVSQYSSPTPQLKMYTLSKSVIVWLWSSLSSSTTPLLALTALYLAAQQQNKPSKITVYSPSKNKLTWLQSTISNLRLLLDTVWNGHRHATTMKKPTKI